MREIKFRYRYEQNYGEKRTIVTRIYNLKQIAKLAKLMSCEKILSIDESISHKDKKNKNIFEKVLFAFGVSRNIIPLEAYQGVNCD